MNSKSQDVDCDGTFHRPEETQEVENAERNDEDLSSENPGEKHTQNSKKTVYFTVAVYASVFCLGLACSMVGPSLLDLRELYQIPTSSVLILISCIPAGFLTGSLLGGYLFYKLNDRFYFLFGSCGIAITFIVVLWIPNFPVVCAVLTVAAMFEGILEVASHVFIMTTWRTNRHLESLTMATSVAWSFGSFLAPIMLEPFLSESSKDLTKDVANGTTAGPIPPVRGTKIQYGWLVISLVFCMAVALNGTSFCWDGMHRKKREITTENTKGSQRHTKFYRVLVSSFACSMYFFYICIEQSLGSYLTVYVVEGLLWEKYKGPLITSVYWGLFGMSQVVAVFLTRFVTPLKIIFAHFVFVSIALLVLSLTAHLSETVVWVCVAVVGYSEGPFFHCGFLLMNKYLPIDGFLSSIILCSSCISSMINVPLMGYIFTTYGSSAMTFTLLVFAVATIVNLCLMSWIVPRYQKKELREMSTVEVIDERVELNRSA